MVGGRIILMKKLILYSSIIVLLLLLVIFVLGLIVTIVPEDCGTDEECATRQIERQNNL